MPDKRRPPPSSPAAPPVEDPWARWRKGAPAIPPDKPAASASASASAKKPERRDEGKKTSARPARIAPAKSSPLAALAPAAEKPSDKPPAEGVRLSKVMATRGLCSRREADLWIERGWVFVNGERIDTLGSRIDPDAAITLDPAAKADQARLVTILLHKPVGIVSGQPEPGATPAISLISGENQVKAQGDADFKPHMLRGLAPAGRLDVDSTGLLVLTQDGRVAKSLIGEDSPVEKEYLVRVDGRLTPEGLKRLNHGLSLDGKALKPARVKPLNEDQLHFILKEGKKRQIRRMCELVGLQVIGLKRVRIGRIPLGSLPLGKWRLLRDGEGF